MSLKSIYNRTISDREYVMPFGKHKGSSIDEIIELEPRYLLWLQENTDVDFHCDLLEEAEEVAESFQP